MEEQDNLEHRFDDIYHNNISSEELNRFKEMLEVDNELRIKFGNYLMIQEAIQEESRKKFRLKFKKEIERPTKKNIRRIFLRNLSIAASVLLLITSLFSYNHLNYWNKINKRYSLIFDKSNYLGDPIIDNQLPASDEDRILLKNENFIKKGNQALKNEEYLKAIEEFKNVVIISEEEYNDFFVAQYNIAVSYSRMEDKENAIATIKKIKARPESHFLKKEVHKLLRDLNKRSIFLF